MTTNKPQEDNQLIERLITEARQQNKEFGLYVEDAEILCDTASEIITIYPTVCYKIFTRTIPNEDVRDIVISGSAQQWFNNLMAGGKTAGSVSIVCHNMNDELVTHSCSPALLFRQAEVHPITKKILKKIVNN